MAHLSIGKTAISYIGPKPWNSIPRSIKQSESLESFKNNFKDYLMLTESSFFSLIFNVLDTQLGLGGFGCG